MLRNARADSPVAQHQPLSALPPNERSYSRKRSSLGGDSFALSSPLPYFTTAALPSSRAIIGSAAPLPPSTASSVPRRRSVRFAGIEDDEEEEKSVVYRETRPDYSGSVRGECAREIESPPPRGRSRETTGFARYSQSPQPYRQDAAMGGQKSISPRPAGRRTRSASAQRLAQRRREAQLHQSFYDDSFVEDFVLKTKEELDAEEKRERDAKSAAEASRLEVVKEAKEKLLAATSGKRTLSPPVGGSSAKRSYTREPSSSAREDETNRLLQSLEDDPDPAIQAALLELERLRGMKMPTTRRSALKTNSSSKGKLEEDHGTVSACLRPSTRKRSRSSRLVLRENSEESLVSDEENSVEPPGLQRRRGSKRPTAASRRRLEVEEDEDAPLRWRSVLSRRRASGGRSLSLASEPALVVGSRRVLSQRASRDGKRGQRNGGAASLSGGREYSAVPDLSDQEVNDAGEGSDLEAELTLEEEEVHRVLPRRRRPAVASRVLGGGGKRSGGSLPPAVERITCKPPSMNGGGQWRVEVSGTRAAPSRSLHNAVPPFAPPHRRVTHSHDHDVLDEEMLEDAVRASAARQVDLPGWPSGRTNPVSRARTAPPVRPPADDPMAIFLDVAFPSPSKFDQLAQNAGVVRTRRRGQNQSLNLPRFIARPK